MKSCAITGHRPTRFKFGYKENMSGCKRLKKRLHDQFVLLYEQGVRTFYVGGALGVDQWSGEILLRLKEQPEYGGIELIVVLPFTGHEDGWDERSKARLLFLLQQSAKVVIVCNAPSAEAYKARNRYMVDHSDVLVAVYDNARAIRSGTGMTVNYAQLKGIPLILIHPDSAVVSNL